MRDRLRRSTQRPGPSEASKSIGDLTATELVDRRSELHNASIRNAQAKQRVIQFGRQLVAKEFQINQELSVVGDRLAELGVDVDKTD